MIVNETLHQLLGRKLSRTPVERAREEVFEAALLNNIDDGDGVDGEPMGEEDGQGQAREAPQASTGTDPHARPAVEPVASKSDADGSEASRPRMRRPKAEDMFADSI